MKLSDYLSVLSLVTLLGYIAFNEARDNEPDDKLLPGFTSQGIALGNYIAKSITLPEQLTFAGEQVPLDEPDVRERLDRELHINTYWHNNTIFIIKRAHRWFPAIERILDEESVPNDFKYLPAIESNFLNDTSPKNAVGFWQIRKSTGREMGLEITREVDERYDPVKSTRAACKYLKKAYKKFGNWTMVAGSYNRGMTGIQNAIEKQKTDSYYDLLLNSETSRYVFRILAIKEIIENPENYYFKISDDHLYNPYNVEYVEVTESIPDLVEFSEKLGINYKQLKKYNPWLRQDKLTVRGNKKYLIAIPV